MSNQHVLKIHPAPLADLLSGAKTAEVRRNDRGFQVGDTVRLMEVNPETGNWTGAADNVRTISHIQTGYGLPDGMCVLSYVQPFVPRNRLPGRLAIRAALPDVPGDMLDHGLFAALDAMGAQAEQQQAQGAQAGDDVIKLFERIIRQSPADLDRATDDNPWYQVTASEVREFAAALATQPAAKKTLDEMRKTKEWLYGYRAALNAAAIKFRRADGTPGKVSKQLLELRRETFDRPAVRGAEHDL